MRMIIFNFSYTYFFSIVLFFGFFVRDAVHNLALADNSVEVEVAGSIKTFCANTILNLPLKIGDITKSGVSTVAFTVNCNTPFEYSIESAHGAMRLAGSTAGTEQQNEIPYNVRVRIPLTYGGEIDDSCSSAAIRAGAITCSFTDSGGKIVVEQRAEAYVSWTAPTRVMPTGNYEDQLIILFSSKI